MRNVNNNQSSNFKIEGSYFFTQYTNYHQLHNFKLEGSYTLCILYGKDHQVNMRLPSILLYEESNGKINKNKFGCKVFSEKFMRNENNNQSTNFKIEGSYFFTQYTNYHQLHNFKLEGSYTLCILYGKDHQANMRLPSILLYGNQLTNETVIQLTPFLHKGFVTLSTIICQYLFAFRHCEQIHSFCKKLKSMLERRQQHKTF